ncbi:RNA polymerase II subunit A domain phosphatase [Coprinopsis cinerea okayama7|uniref:RNA polymerase II subunit A C-terminal domain phosphatase n=1 Tax=Coprinopsis cinerea (strain Okayama-7 / 130 / ATCC MYA-4618 / FGSC 9003) TaxID=240176 RepID=D6RJR1_COPC7|nr:RNA polymerase II subunit A domain phosphatase [Coprinopsis cinerea okayama7\|eukprot:XP_002912206.1 RNA polymerase II subunit A domain phosphatase [Coprinopsis cinerea okayama7\
MQSEDPTELYLPQSFPFPIKIVSLDIKPTEWVEPRTRLLSYSFVYLPRTQDAKPETRYGTWDCPIEGTLKTWNIKVGDVISKDKARAQPALVILEPCKHSTQIHGLCANCGKDVTIVDYTGFSHASRAGIQMTHSAFGPTVSFEEAQRIERETAEHLLKSRKLSLIVDLDQTIVHATVDPTVGEWIAEGEAWEARQERRNKVKTTTPDSDDSDSSDDSDDDEDDECNPNWEALKDVKKFTLGPESFNAPSVKGRSKGKHRMVEQEGCMYYIKPRPGWKEFLENAAKKYEMHVYTMGTRAYAQEVCAAIDPDGKLFGSRLLSRDESGSLTQKSLQRLFPCDTSMVVIIDDRADVWEWSPNLLKVIPYDFFVGIGDINSTFLPKLDAASLPTAPKAKDKATPSLASNGTTAKAETPPNPDDLPESKPGEEPEPEPAPKDILVTQNNAALDAQLEERPLAKKEKELQEHEAAEASSSSSESSASSESHTEAQPHPHHHRKALLKNDDTELQRIGMLLDEVHSRFYREYDARSSDNDKRRPSFGSKHKPYDVTLGTVKVDMARKRGGILVVSQGWLADSIAQWRRMDEKPYLLDDPSFPVLDLPATETTTHDTPTADDDMFGISDTMTTGAPLIDLSASDWADLNDEVEAAMNESDDGDDDEDGMMDGYRSENASEADEWEAVGDDASVKSAGSSPGGLKRKRLRSTTPSETGGADEADLLRSPLAKRKKIALERTGLSRLKEGITATDLDGQSNGDSPGSPMDEQGEGLEEEDEEEEDDEEEGEDDAFDDDDDFLARELESELS